MRLDGDPALSLLHQDGVERQSSWPVLFVHGSTFPSALASGYRFDGGSWMDDLAAVGFDTWALDFAGFGESGSYAEMGEAPAGSPPLGRAPEAAVQVARAVDVILDRTAKDTLDIVAHSWGCLATGRYVTRQRGRVRRLVFFGPIARREAVERLPNFPPFLDITLEQQYARFIDDVPDDHESVLADFDRWSEAYLDGDHQARDREPPAVRVPAGPAADIMTAWAGYYPYEPAAIDVPMLIVRGSWDGLCTEADAAWFLDRIPTAADVVIPEATHLMHLETGRHQLYAATREFLLGGSASGRTKGG